MGNTEFRKSSVFFILFIYRIMTIMKEKNHVVSDEVLSKKFLSQVQDKSRCQ